MLGRTTSPRMAGAIQGHLDLQTQMDEAKVAQIVAAEIARARLPRPIEVHLPEGKVVTLEGRQHKQFTEVLDLIEEGAANILLVGPAGTGKTTMAKAVAKALDLDFGFISLSAGVTETHLFGRLLPQTDGTWAYVASRFVEVYENGGVFLLDEVDAADANVMVAVNAALANGVMSNPVNGKIHVRHPKTIILAAANTFGRGGDTMYVGRNSLDVATLDRFVLDTLHIDYDRELEWDIVRSLVSDDDANEIMAWVDALRDQIISNRIRRVASMRLVERAARAISKGRKLADVKARFFAGWSKDELAKVGGAA
jgi:cobaltochelatase CobS